MISKYTYVVSDVYWKVKQFAILNNLNINRVKWVNEVSKIRGLRSGTVILNVLSLSNNLIDYNNIIDYAKSKEFEIVYIMN